LGWGNAWQPIRPDGPRQISEQLSLTETAKLNMCDPEDYLQQVLDRIADHSVKRVHELLHWNLTTVHARLDQRAARKTFARG
jgi:transposase